jgi:hypothetical protein
LYSPVEVVQFQKAGTAFPEFVQIAHTGPVDGRTVDEAGVLVQLLPGLGPAGAANGRGAGHPQAAIGFEMRVWVGGGQEDGHALQ